jgi:hypothetical protein
MLGAVEVYEPGRGGAARSDPECGFAAFRAIFFFSYIAQQIGHDGTHFLDLGFCELEGPVLVFEVALEHTGIDGHLALIIIAGCLSLGFCCAGRRLDAAERESDVAAHYWYCAS